MRIATRNKLLTLALVGSLSLLLAGCKHSTLEPSRTQPPGANSLGCNPWCGDQIRLGCCATFTPDPTTESIP